MLKGQKLPPNEVWIGVPAEFLRKRKEKEVDSQNQSVTND